jgi:cytochrome c
MSLYKYHTIEHSEPGYAIIESGAANGAELFRIRCHIAGPGEANKVGPYLYGIFGRKAGQAQGYCYTEALKTEGVVWTQEALFDFWRVPKWRLLGLRKAMNGGYYCLFEVDDIERGEEGGGERLAGALPLPWRFQFPFTPSFSPLSTSLLWHISSSVT